MTDITYELASELKEAGFPQGLEEGSPNFYTSDGKKLSGSTPFKSDLSTFKIPTLPKLIEECLRLHDDEGDKMSMLKLVCVNPDPGSSFLTYAVQGEGENIMKIEYYQSPEEAVSRRYLVLNKE